jgi:hypothetical protein
VEFDLEQRTLRFVSDEELASFHQELTALLRQVTVSISSSTTDAEQARKGAQQVLKEFRLIARLLNSLRRQHAVPRSDSGAG